MATGPCGLEFREAFSCFHFSTAEPKGTDCYEAFKTMQVCMSQYPALYESKGSIDDLDDDDDDDDDDDEKAAPKQSVSADSQDKRNAVTAIEGDAKIDQKTVDVSSTKEVEQSKINRM
ncbi:Mitochondrial intermembrane space import and assembly protein 40 [Harpegnathos saltator]|uniref:Mitochondrial intermembrane space import and assembly protein 40 n=2 Tax=Harpegnathos saltator TaxID=610380 RepID=E2C8K0_HARSA|nr:Mitochondrial intermembrane space import and assembly protein 40 [Harpegnathos saltator]